MHTPTASFNFCIDIPISSMKCFTLHSLGMMVHSVRLQEYLRLATVLLNGASKCACYTSFAIKDWMLWVPPRFSLLQITLRKRLGVSFKPIFLITSL